MIVQEGVYEELQSRLVAAAEKLRLGPGWEDGADVGPVINKRALEKIHSYTEIGMDEGAKLLTGGEVASGNGLGDGFFYRPTIFGDVDPQMRDRAGGDLRPDDRADPRDATSTRRSASRTGSSSASRRRSSRAT